MTAQRHDRRAFRSAELLILVLIGIVIALMLVPVVRMAFWPKGQSTGASVDPAGAEVSPANRTTPRMSSRLPGSRVPGNTSDNLLAGSSSGDGTRRSDGPSSSPTP